MIAKTFFLTKIIHRIGTQSIRQEKSLPENQAETRHNQTENRAAQVAGSDGLRCLVSYRAIAGV
jgi:hypothetical protein